MIAKHVIICCHHMTQRVTTLKKQVIKGEKKMKGKTKRTASRFCSAVLSATTLMSMLTFFPANAVEAEQKPTEKPQTSYENTDIPKDMRASGDLTIEQGLSENAKIIKSIDEYYKELENDDITVLGKVKRKKMLLCLQALTTVHQNISLL